MERYERNSRMVWRTWTAIACFAGIHGGRNGSDRRLLLTLGLLTRLIVLPLMAVMLVAIFTVHINNGFSCGDNGFEVPFYYLLMLLALFANGAGKLSLDAIFFERSDEK